MPAEYFGEGLDPEIRAAIERTLDGLRAGRLRDQEGLAAAYQVRDSHLLRDCDGGGLGQPLALRRRALRTRDRTE